MTSASIAATRSELESRYADLAGRGRSLDMTRGKPCPEQLDLSSDLFTILRPNDYRAADGTDCRNYGGLEGLPEARRLFADFLDAAPDEVLIGDNSSLALMHDSVARALSHGVPGGSRPWREGEVRFLCPAPGYDRHFTVCEHFGIEMLSVGITPDGVDIEQVERLAASDESVKGIWIVPKYGNPTGVTCSPEVVQALAGMRTAAPDFRIFWDNAYAHHHLTETDTHLESLLAACKAAGNPDRVLTFGSTSKITFAGAGLAVIAASRANIEWLVRHRSVQTIGPDKINQLRHVRFFGDMDGVRAHMRKHAVILRPKFEAVDRVLHAELAGVEGVEWTRPLGGYFVSLDTPEGCASRVVALAAGAGVKLTPAGATFPYGRDSLDRNIRIAPSLPSLPQIEAAMEVVGVCVKLAIAERG
jgi:DNA-binding transcriptional MocR family regulator